MEYQVSSRQAGGRAMTRGPDLSHTASGGASRGGDQEPRGWGARVGWGGWTSWSLDLGRGPGSWAWEPGSGNSEAEVSRVRIGKGAG